MESIKIRTYIGDDGILKIQLPPEIANQELDVVIVFQPVIKESLQSSTKTPQEHLLKNNAAINFRNSVVRRYHAGLM
ncbi:hypothetical protein [Dendronalium sp. ChiSLP03b]|uniref:hypothetical protein n=1 Tax=Dendronalium sp. ChiSLP03b TaxID=3075381 RepID=UPI00391DF616